MRADSFFDRHRVIAAAGVVAAHAQAGDAAFRQRDVKFLFELFLNWTEHGVGFRNLQVQNTQISRWLDALAREGLARRLERERQPRYRLTRVGLIEMLGQMSRGEYIEHPEQFFFVHFFLETYRERIVEMVRREGAQFPHALHVELREVLDSARLCERQLEIAARELDRLDARIRDSLSGSALVVKMTREGRDQGEIVSAVEKRFPYELNSQKPLSELARDLSPELLCWELDVGAVRRSELIFIPARKALVHFMASVREVARKANEARSGGASGSRANR